MSILIRRFALLALTLVTLTLLAACGPSNNVRLIYNTNTSAVLPLPGSPSVAVVMFNDERTRQYIGERKDGSVFTASSTIADWFTVRSPTNSDARACRFLSPPRWNRPAPPTPRTS